jgi:hypothetical protein
LNLPGWEHQRTKNENSQQGEAGNGGKIGCFEIHGFSSRRSCSLTLAKNMSVSLLHTNLGSRSILYGVIALILAVMFVSLLWQPVSQRFFPVTVPIEDVLWTATPDYKIFFGPGTTQSAELAARLRSLKKDYTLPETAYRFPNTPLFISPRIFMSGGSANDIVIYSPFTPDSIAVIHSDYLRGQQRTNR